MGAVADEALEVTHDIEELAASGNRLEGCAYYAARRAASQAEIILMPYGSLLHEDTRRSLGISLSGRIVVFDEAHNIDDALAGCYSANINLHELEVSCSALSNYIERFRTKLAPDNLRSLSMMHEVTRCLHCFLTTSTFQSHGVYRLNDFLRISHLHNVNIFRLTGFVRNSKVLLKLSNYAQAFEDAAAESDESITASSALQSFVSFMSALGSGEADGRILVHIPSEECDGKSTICLKYVLLDSVNRFSPIVSEARSVILAGGTLSPIEGLVNRLFPEARKERDFRAISCSHIIRSQNLLCSTLATGPTGQKLNFGFKHRKQEVTDELGRAVLNICKLSPAGVILFLPSYAYLQTVENRWSETGQLAKLGKHKHIFTEPRSATDIEHVLSQFSRAAQGDRGALLLCVVGGKLSEGINFADELGRCIILAGLPYPSPNDTELQERMRFLDEIQQQTASSNALSGRAYYETLCTRAVNQSVGRAIRHASDYAAIVLCDERYSVSEGAGAKARLSGWMLHSLVPADSFGACCKQLGRFFRSHDPQRHS